MPNVVREPVSPGEFLLSEANGSRSRDEVVVGRHSLTFSSGAVVGRITLTRNIGPYDPDAVDGRQNAAGVLYAAVDAREADQPGVLIARDAEANGHYLAWPDSIETADKADAIADLAERGIIVR